MNNTPEETGGAARVHSRPREPIFAGRQPSMAAAAERRRS